MNGIYCVASRSFVYARSPPCSDIRTRNHPRLLGDWNPECFFLAATIASTLKWFAELDHVGVQLSGKPTKNYKLTHSCSIYFLDLAIRRNYFPVSKTIISLCFLTQTFLRPYVNTYIEKINPLLATLEFNGIGTSCASSHEHSHDASFLFRGKLGLVFEPLSTVSLLQVAQ